MREDAGVVAHGIGLERVQRWMQAVVTHPEGVHAGVASDEARTSIGLESSALESLEPSALESIVAPSASLTGAERLSIYSHAYRARLLQSLRETFPALLHALGEELFDLFALDYLKGSPPRSYTLDRLADGFAEHLAETRPDAEGERESWIDFVIELATLEHAFAKVYDGPGLEGRASLDAEELRARGDARLLEARPAHAPSLRLFAFSHPVHNYMLDARGGGEPSRPGPSETFVALTRRDYTVVIYELDAPQYSFLNALDGRRTVAEALDAAAPFVGLDARLRVARGWLCEWADRSFFESA